MSISKIKEELKKKLKQETSGTGTGASVTPGAGEGVATKYAFGKTNKSKPEGWKDTPSVPNRKSKAMDYKELWEQEITTVSDITATLASDASKRLTIPKGSKVQVLKKRLEKEPNVTQLMYGDQKVNVSAGPFINQYLFEKEENKIGEASELKPLKKDDDVYEPEEQDDDEDSYDWFTNKNIKEGYAQFRNETKMRSKPDQFHQAVKSVKKKMSEINRLFEYMDRLKTELSEGEELKHKKYTESALQQIKESAKALFFKSTKLK